MPAAIAWYYKLASYIAPITLRTIHSQYSSTMLLQLYQAQLVLTTSNAMYSFGTQYAPFKQAFAYLSNIDQLHPQRFLLLGGALLSASQILHKKYNMHPATTVVEMDGKFQELISTYLPIKIVETINYKHNNAQHFVAECTDTFDMIGIDLFIEMQMPAFCLQQQFLQNCKQLLTTNGVVIMNTIFMDSTTKNNFSEIFKSVFSSMHTIQYQNNYVFIGRIFYKNHLN